jgi:hypothetical protein
LRLLAVLVLAVARAGMMALGVSIAEGMELSRITNVKSVKGLARLTAKNTFPG